MMLLLPIITIGNSGSLFSQNDVKPILSNYYNTRLCGTERNKDVLILIEVGTVSLKDSLYGFDFSISYDPDYLKFETPVFINTISEFFEWKDINFGMDYGKVKGYALHDFPLGGNKPLIGFAGKYISECSEKTPLVLEYLEFTDDFQRKVSKADTLWIKPDIVVNPDYKYNIGIEQENVIFKEEDAAILNASIEFSTVDNIDEISFDVLINSDNYIIEEIYPKDNSFEILERNVLQSGLNLNIKLSETTSPVYDFEIIVRELRKDSNKVYSLNVVPLQLSQCNCVSEYRGDKIEIRTVIVDDDTTVAGVNDNIYSNQVSIFTDDVFITIDNSSELNMKAIHLFNYEGKLLESFINLDTKQFRINKSELIRGVYFLNIQLSDSEFVKKAVLIYN